MELTQGGRVVEGRGGRNGEGYAAIQHGGGGWEHAVRSWDRSWSRG